MRRFDERGLGGCFVRVAVGSGQRLKEGVGIEVLAGHPGMMGPEKLD